MLFGIGSRYPSITLDEAWWRPKNRSPDAWSPPLPELLIPFDGDGHWDMGFDYRKRGPVGEPAVTFVDCEGEREDSIADSFVEYLAGWVDEVAETETRIYGDVNPESVVRQLSRQMGVSEATVEVDDFSYGYPTWRIALPGQSEWCWCSPNRLPAGFRREGKQVIVTDQTAFRIPDDPDCVVLLGCTESSKGAIRAALVALRLVTR
jgi:hypothetical protein